MSRSSSPIRLWFRVALANFLAAALIGVTLRYAFVEELSWLKFRDWMHGHSHVAMLGWIYLALYSLIVDRFLSPEQQRNPLYALTFWLTEFSVLGMLVSFPLQGYGPYSIAFSGMHILFSYVFVFQLWRDLGRQPGRGLLSHRFLKTALVFMVLSTLAIWAMPVFVATGRQGSLWYYLAVQFFLHFQFNGWFLFAAFGLWLFGVETQVASLPRPTLYRFYWIFVIASVLTYALAVAWGNPRPEVFAVNGAGVLLQLAALLFLLAALRRLPVRELLSPLSFWEKNLLRLAFASFVAKVVMQSVVVLPFVAEAAYTIRNYVIGFIHLILLGTLTFFLLQQAGRRGLLNSRGGLVRAGFLSLVIGFFLSEGLLFLQGTLFWAAMGFLPYYYELLFAGSAFLPLGVGLVLAGALFQSRKKRNEETNPAG